MEVIIQVNFTVNIRQDFREVVRCMTVIYRVSAIYRAVICRFDCTLSNKPLIKQRENRELKSPKFVLIKTLYRTILLANDFLCSGFKLMHLRMRGAVKQNPK